MGTIPLTITIRKLLAKYLSLYCIVYIYIRAPQQIAQIGNSCNSIRETNWVVRLAQNSHIMRC